MLVSRDHCAQITGTVAKAASGALDSVPIISVVNLARALEQLAAAGLWLAGTVQDAPATIYECDFNLPLAVVLGSEAKGLRHLTREKCDHLVRIPMAGRLLSFKRRDRERNYALRGKSTTAASSRLSHHPANMLSSPPRPPGFCNVVLVCLEYAP